jgi:putative ABC transport system permease protein
VNQGTSVLVRGVSALDEPTQGAPPTPVDAALLEQVRSVDGVAEAVGRVGGYAQLIVDSKPVESGGPSLGVDIQPGSALETLTVRSGSAPGRPGEVAVDAATAERVGIEVGDRVQVAVASGVLDVTVTGTVGLGDSDGFAGASLTAFDAGTARELLAVPGTFQEIAIAAEEGVDDAALAARIGATLPDTAEAVTAAQSSAETSADIKEGLGCSSSRASRCSSAPS